MPETHRDNQAEILAIRQSLNDEIGCHVRNLYKQAVADRQMYEQEWLRDLRQHKGIDEKVWTEEESEACKAFIRITRTKVKTMDARMMDTMFPAGSTRKFFSVLPTPVPDTGEEVIQEVQKVINQETGGTVSIEEVSQTEDFDKTLALAQQKIMSKAKIKARRMEETIHDQLYESHFIDEARKAIHDGNILGTGILKGPQTEVKSTKRWIRSDEEFVIRDHIERKPFFEHVPLWQVFFDLDALKLEDCEYIIHRHTLTKAQLQKYARRKGWDAETIHAYTRGVPTGDCHVSEFEQQMRLLTTGQTTVKQNSRKYELLEAWCYISGDDLKAAGIDIPDDMLEHEFDCQAYVLGSSCVKVQINPTAQQSRPFHVYYFEKDDTSLYGVGIANIMRDTQGLYNNAIRLAVDNAALASGPQVEINTKLITNKNDLKLKRWRIWLRSGDPGDFGAPAIRFTNIPSYVEQLMSLSAAFKDMGDEASTIPSYMSGEGASQQGAGKTATGLSMLMGAAQITVKDVVTNFDEGIIKPAISALYHYNMQFSDREEIKGDMEVMAEGSRSLMTRELQLQNMAQFAQLTVADGALIDRRKLWEKYADLMELPQDLVYSEDQADKLVGLEQAVQESQMLIDMLTRQLQAVGIDPETGNAMNAA